MYKKKVQDIKYQADCSTFKIFTRLCRNCCNPVPNHSYINVNIMQIMFCHDIVNSYIFI